jgi:hypothetical protein
MRLREHGVDGVKSCEGDPLWRAASIAEIANIVRTPVALLTRFCTYITAAYRPENK